MPFSRLDMEKINYSMMFEAMTLLDQARFTLVFQVLVTNLIVQRTQQLSPHRKDERVLFRSTLYRPMCDSNRI